MTAGLQQKYCSPACIEGFVEEERFVSLREQSNSNSNVGHLKFRAVWPVIRAAGLVPWTAVFAVLYVAAIVIVASVEPALNGIADSAWLMFQVVTTIGLGDFAPTSIIGRMATVGRLVTIALSLYSVFFLALVTGAVVSYCSETMNARRDQSVAQFLDQLEHLPELSTDELEELSEKVKLLHRRGA